MAEVASILETLGRLRAFVGRLGEDVGSAMANDPAARSRAEVLLAYPGVHALWLHRAAHALWKRKLPLTARALSHANRFLTGIEIHPGATIGRGVFIDHGMGIVIGETASVGDGCLIYKGVVLGGTSHERTIRHPQLGRNVVVGSNACVLGHIQIGDGARIGSGSVVIRDVPPGATVVGVPGRIVPPRAKEHMEEQLDHANLPDPVADLIRDLAAQNEKLRSRLGRVEAALKIPQEPERARLEPASVAPEGPAIGDGDGNGRTGPPPEGD